MVKYLGLGATMEGGGLGLQTHLPGATSSDFSDDTLGISWQVLAAGSLIENACACPSGLLAGNEVVSALEDDGILLPRASKEGTLDMVVLSTKLAHGG